MKERGAPCVVDESVVPFFAVQRSQLFLDYHRVIDAVPDGLWLGESKEGDGVHTHGWIGDWRGSKKKWLDAGSGATTKADYGKCDD